MVSTKIFRSHLIFKYEIKYVSWIKAENKGVLRNILSIFVWWQGHCKSDFLAFTSVETGNRILIIFLCEVFIRWSVSYLWSNVVFDHKNSKLEHVRKAFLLSSSLLGGFGTKTQLLGSYQCSSLDVRSCAVSHCLAEFSRWMESAKRLEWGHLNSSDAI